MASQILDTESHKWTYFGTEGAGDFIKWYINDFFLLFSKVKKLSMKENWGDIQLKVISIYLSS